MALRDRFNKLATYFSPDDLDDVEDMVEEDEEDEQEAVETPTRPEPVEPTVQQQATYGTRPTAPTSRPDYPRPTAPKTRPQRPEPVVSSAKRDFEVFGQRPTAPVSRPTTTAQETKEEGMEQRTKITLKHPITYEDAPLIADLFLAGECVLIDFEYMQDAQARRCIDFFWGACRVVEGNLKRIGGNMFLLTPKTVLVDIEDIMAQQKEQSVSYDYDMKRRTR